ncbi:PRA1 family protein F3-like [Andrographis paniculata]|uniref:PRA1 family protein F3-like n=1 Tax=Andrographis paniculata TaxID=175694 RepID=UPI0021E97FE0|nr:PRA1 family protein F3-like [Andrographis paniculata]
MSTTYGTIPTGRSGAPPPSDLPSSRSVMLARRPWREMVTSLSLPRSVGAAAERSRANAAYFHVNYSIIVLFALFVSLLWHPVSLVVFLATMAAWLFLYFLRDDQIVLCGYAVEERVVLVVLSIFTVCLLLMTHAAVFLVGAAVGLLLVAAHAVVRNTGDSDLQDMAPFV